MLYIGVDLGGTNIAAGLVDEKGVILKKDKIPTIANRPIKEIIRDMAMLCEKVAMEADYTIDNIEAIGIGCPGIIDSQNGIVVYASNIPMKNFKIKEELQKYIKKNVHVENDANAAAYGEYIINGENADSFILITLGTGVGSGIIINKEIYRGFNGAGGEIGHTLFMPDGMPCNCGRTGCWEAYASVTALINQTKETMKNNSDSMMNKLVKEDGKVSGRTAFEAAKAGDHAGKAVVDQYIKYVAMGIINVLNIFQPEKVLIGGGISKEGDYLLNPIKEYVYKNEFNRYMPKTKIEIAKLFNDAGIIGAALSAKQ